MINDREFHCPHPTSPKAKQQQLRNNNSRFRFLFSAFSFVRSLKFYFCRDPKQTKLSRICHLTGLLAARNESAIVSFHLKKSHDFEVSWLVRLCRLVLRICLWQCLWNELGVGRIPQEKKSFYAVTNSLLSIFLSFYLSIYLSI